MIVGAFALLIATCYPRGGGTGLVIPVLPAARGPGMAWLAQQGAATVSPSTAARFSLVQMPSDLIALRAMGHGLLIVAVPAALCSSQDK